VVGKGDFVVLAAEPAHLVGVDVMQIRRPLSESVPDFFRLMRRQFTPEEWLAIEASPESGEEERLHRFYQHWCLKESYIKATGIGLGLEGGLERLSFKSDPIFVATRAVGVAHGRATATLDVQPLAPPSWYLEETYLDPSHCVATILGPFSVRLSPVDWKSLF
jgi:4'-phosphopantetheinyl transferase